MNATIRFITHQFRRGPFARDPNLLFDDGLTFGERLADRVATIGGSWSFIIGFSIFLVAWALLNTVVLVRHAFADIFDPEPPRTFAELRRWLAGQDIEGLVWHHPDGRMAKIKRRDFGLERVPTTEEAAP